MQLNINKKDKNEGNESQSSQQRPRTFNSNAEKQAAAAQDYEKDEIEKQAIEEESNIEDVEAVVLDEDKNTNKVDTVVADPNEPEEKKLKFKPGGLGGDFFAKKTKESSSSSDLDVEGKESEVDSYKVENDNEYEREAEALSWEDLLDLSEFGIEILDTGVSTLSSAIAKDSGTQKYEVPSFKKKKLSKQLAKILEKYSFKLKIEFMFAISLILVFSDPVRKALKVRKEKRAEEESKMAKTLADNATKKPVVKKTITKEKEIENEDSQEAIEEIPVEDATIVSESEPRANKRSRTAPSFGGPREFYEQN